MIHFLLIFFSVLFIVALIMAAIFLIVPWIIHANIGEGIGSLMDRYYDWVGSKFKDGK